VLIEAGFENVLRKPVNRMKIAGMRPRGVRRLQEAPNLHWS